jgi:hypothetical protein
MMELVWVDGIRQPLEEDEWHQTAATFFGIGYRTTLPVVANVAEPVNFHRNLAEKLATTLGRPFDRAPWEFIEAGNLPTGAAVEVVGGWPSPGVSFGEPAGNTPWSAIAQIAPAAHDATYGSGVSLPWTSNPISPLAGLPVLSRLEDEQASRHVRNAGAAVGLWWNDAEHLTGSTVGVPLVQTGKRSWIYPDLGAGIVSSWAFFNIANALSAMPDAITLEAVRSSKAVAFVSGTGAVTVLESIDGQPVTADREQVLALLTTRLRFLA